MTDSRSYAVRVVVDVYKHPSRKMLPTPREVAAFIQEKLNHADTDDGWHIGMVTGDSVVKGKNAAS